MTREFLTRQSDIISDTQLNTSVTIVGCGGIGSHTAMALARMGIKTIELIDPDKVSIVNVGSQGFDIGDVGKHKVDVTKRKIFNATRTIVKTSKIIVNESSPSITNSIVIMAVDNMHSRKIIFGKTVYGYIINPAMGAEYLSIDTYPDRETGRKEFDESWFSDDEGVQESCTSKATIYTTLMVSGLICKIVKDIITRNKYTKHITYDIKNNAPIAIFNSDGNDLIN